MFRTGHPRQRLPGREIAALARRKGNPETVANARFAAREARPPLRGPTVLALAAGLALCLAALFAFAFGATPS